MAEPEAPALTVAEAFNVAAGHLAAGRLDEAERLAAAILGTLPEQPDALHLLAVLRLRRGRPQEAVPLAEAALRHRHGAGVLLTLAQALEGCGRTEETLATWATITRLGSAGAGFEWGRRLLDLRRHDEAAQAFRQALTLDPTLVTAWNGLGMAVSGANRRNEAYRMHGRALRIDPGCLEAAVHAHDCARVGAAFALQPPSLDQLARALRRNGEAADWRLLSSILYRHLYRPLPDDVARRAQGLFSARMRALASTQPPFVHRRRGPAERLRLGYLSDNLNNHPIGQVTLSLFAAHDRERFEVHGFVRRHHPADPYAQRHRRGFDAVHDLDGRTPRQIAEAIHTQGIDVLVFLDGHMNKDGLEAMALRPAPVRVFWLGHAGGIGGACADVVLADTTVLPEDDACEERVVRLPACYHCGDRHALAAPASRAAFGLPEDALVLCGFNTLEKIDAATFTAWCAILRRLPNAVLWLSRALPDQVANLSATAQSLGVAPDRLIFADRVPDKAVHLARHRLADLFLDTWTMNASSMALDALWAGLPILTRQGDTFSNRICGSMLQAVGLEELIAPDADAYVALAVALGRNPQLRAALRRRLEQGVETSHVFDPRRFAAMLEEAYLRLAEGDLEKSA